jgi:ubiquinol-cytochrome c reductase cytochrome b subunit
MRLLKSDPILGLANSYLVDSAQPSSISYMWNFGSLLATCLVVQIVTGVLLAMHYCPSMEMAFTSVEHIIRDVSYGWLTRYTHANTASLFFAFAYLHVARGMYYGSYSSPTAMVWTVGVIILVVMILTAFLGYCLVMGQMSLWGATVITSMLSAVPGVGVDLTQLVWGGFAVSEATLNRFFSLHFLFPFILAALAAVHMLLLHEHGSGNPVGVDGNADRLPMAPYFLFKDLVTFVAFALALLYLVCYSPNTLGHSDNYIEANALVTPASIVPEWYLLPFYAILRSIPNKLLGVIAMLAALLVLLVLPLADTGRTRSAAFRPLMRAGFWSFTVVFVLLLYLGACHVAEPWVVTGQVLTLLYFGYFVAALPVIGLVENTLSDLSTARA